MNYYEDMLIEALDMVAAWEVPDDQLAEVVNAQARLMAGLYPEDVTQRDSCNYYS